MAEILLDPADPLRALQRATGFSGRALALHRGVTQQAHYKSELAGEDVSVRVLRESVEAAGLSLELVASKPRRTTIYDEVAALGSDVERIYREATSREEAMELLARSIGAALSRVDGHRRDLTAVPEFCAIKDEPEGAEPI